MVLVVTTRPIDRRRSAQVGASFPAVSASLQRKPFFGRSLAAFLLLLLLVNCLRSNNNPPRYSSIDPWRLSRRVAF